MSDIKTLIAQVREAEKTRTTEGVAWNDLTTSLYGLVSAAPVLADEVERLERRMREQAEWYARRMRRFEDWFRTTGKDLPIAHEFWNILANGKATHDERLPRLAPAPARHHAAEQRERGGVPRVGQVAGVPAAGPGYEHLRREEMDLREERQAKGGRQ